MKSNFTILFLSLIITISLEFFINNSGDFYKDNFIKTQESIFLTVSKRIEITTQPIDILFLGDSTVGSALDEKLFFNLTGMRAVNLALAGDYITYGDFIVLKKYLLNHPPPKMIFVWHTIDVWPRSLNAKCFAFTQPDLRTICRAIKTRFFSFDNPPDLLRWPIQFLSQLTDNLIMYIPSYRYREWLKKSFENTVRAGAILDIINSLGKERYESKVNEQVISFTTFHFTISSESKFWFLKFVQLAKKNNILVLAGRSPIHEAFLKNKKAKIFLDRSNAILTSYYKSLGVEQIDSTNFVFPRYYGEDDKDHVNDAGKKAITEYYARIFEERYLSLNKH